MSIFKAAESDSFAAAAYEYLLDGLSVIPLIGKKCPIPWTVYMTNRARSQDVNWWTSTRKLQNIGVVCGAVSGNLVVIDLDGSRAVKLFREQFPDLMNTYTVLTGSGGLHVYLKVGSVPPNRKISLGSGHSGIEIRGNGQYVVAPPSIHPDTKRMYKIFQKQAILSVFSLIEVSEWLGTLETPKTAVLPPPKEPPKAERGGVPMFFDKVRYPQAWTRAAVAKECDIVARCSEGRRNDQLNTSAYNLGQIVGIGWLTTADAERNLLSAAKSAGLSESEALPTIRSGLNKGINEARDIQWQRRGNH